MKQLNKFINEKLKLNNQSKIVDNRILELTTYMIGFNEHTYNDPIPKIVRKWLIDNNVQNLDIYINHQTWNNIKRDWGDEYEADYIIISKTLFDKQIDDVNLDLLYDTDCEIYANSKQLLYNIYDDMISDYYMSFLLVKKE